jgi:uncharacterized SAM-binding protein YcdF (DUF218 family)
MKMNKTMGRFFRVSICLSLGINFCLALVLFSPLSESITRFLINEDHLRKNKAEYDSIIVLSCSMYSDGTLGFETLMRLKKGIDLYKTGYADLIICSGGVRSTSGGKSIARRMKEELVDYYQIDPDDILVQDETINTYNDISGLLAKFGDRIDFNNSIFVTSSWHTKRVKKILLKKSLGSPVVSADKFQLFLSNWSQRFGLFKELAREHGALIYFKLHGYI